MPEAAGFADFDTQLIGDYNADSEVEYQPNGVYTNSHSTSYLDDIALFMTTKDFRPDFHGEQTIDTYTIDHTQGASAYQITAFALNQNTPSGDSIRHLGPSGNRPYGSYNRHVWFPNHRVMATVQSINAPMSVIRIPGAQS